MRISSAQWNPIDRCMMAIRLSEGTYDSINLSCYITLDRSLILAMHVFTWHILIHYWRGLLSEYERVLLLDEQDSDDDISQSQREEMIGGKMDNKKGGRCARGWWKVLEGVCWVVLVFLWHSVRRLYIWWSSILELLIFGLYSWSFTVVLLLLIYKMQKAVLNY